MIYLEGAGLDAVRTRTRVCLDQSQPFRARELPFGLAKAGAIGVALRTAHLRMGLVVRSHHRFVLRAVPRVVETLRSASLLGMQPAPAARCLARLLDVASYPLACIRALSIRILVRHANIEQIGVVGAMGLSGNVCAMTSDPRAICAECGHVRSWHDREAAHRAARMDPGIDRPCYREVGGTPCRCNGFRESGDVAVAASGTPRPAGAARVAALALLLVVFGLGLLYAYRAQTPSLSTVVITQAIQEVNAGQVRKVTIVTGANTAILELANSERHQTFLPDRDEVFQKALFDYNTANPSMQITIDYQQESATFSVIGSIFLSLLPVLLFAGFFFYLLRRSLSR